MRAAVHAAVSTNPSGCDRRAAMHLTGCASCPRDTAAGRIVRPLRPKRVHTHNILMLEHVARSMKRAICRSGRRRRSAGTDAHRRRGTDPAASGPSRSVATIGPPSGPAADRARIGAGATASLESAWLCRKPGRRSSCTGIGLSGSPAHSGNCIWARYSPCAFAGRAAWPSPSRCPCKESGSADAKCS